MSVPNEILQAAEEAVRSADARQQRVGAVGVRSDGVIVKSANGLSRHHSPLSHAETRLARKLDVGATVYVARVSKADGSLVLARPCPNCMRVLRSIGVRKVVFTTESGIDSLYLN